MSTPANPFLERLEQLRAQRAASQPPTEPTAEVPDYSQYADSVPVFGDDAVSQERLELDTVLSRVDIIDCYIKWCGKMVPEPRGKREGIKISCPIPGHLDRNPSAWVNLDNQTWFCGGCQEGGDKFTLASFRYGIHLNDREKFPELKKLMAQDFGYTVKKTIGGQTLVEKTLPPTVQSGVEQGTPEAPPGASASSGTQLQTVVPQGVLGVVSGGDNLSSSPSTDAGLASVTQLQSIHPEVIAQEDHVEAIGMYPSLDWKSIVTNNTFLGTWMDIFKNDDIPEEYYFWLGLTAIGAAMGGQTILARDEPKVYGNMYVCLLGPSGQGKTRALRPFEALLAKALPYDPSDPHSTGIKSVGTPGSAESLIDAFSKPVMDPSDPKKIAFYAPVRGIVHFAELSALTGRAERQGNVLKPTLMELYDNKYEVSMRSRGAGITIARQPFAILTSTTQPRAIKELVTRADADSGFLNRWVFATGKPKPLFALREGRFDVDPCIEPLQRIRSWCSGTRQIEWEDDAKAEFVRWFNSTVIPVKNTDDPLLHRLDLTVKKVLILLAANEHAIKIRIDHVEKMKIVFDYLKRSYEFLGGHIGVGRFEDCRQAIEHMIRNFEKNRGKDRMPKVRDITRMGRMKNFSSDLISKVLKTMVELGEVEEIVHKPQRGPTTQVYRWVE